MPTLKELSVLYANKQPGQVDQITVAAPILAQLDFKEATHPLWNVYEEITSITGGGMTNFDAELPVVGSDSELRKVDLGVMGGQIEVGEDKAAAYGGKEKYFAKKLPAILKKTGMDTEVAILYNNLRKYAIDNGLVVGAGGTGDAGYTLMAVRFDPEENTGLYSKDGFGKGAILQGLPINGGNLYKNSSGILVYGLRLKSYFGWQIASKYTIQAALNIDATHLPTQKQINKMLLDVRADNNTFLFCHPIVVSWLGEKYKNDFIKYTPQDNAVDNTIGKWNGVPFKTSYNFLNGTETTVTIS